MRSIIIPAEIVGNKTLTDNLALRFGQFLPEKHFLDGANRVGVDFDRVVYI